MTCVVYKGQPPLFPPTDQHPSARRYGPIMVDGATYWVDCVGPPPTPVEVDAMLAGDRRAARVAAVTPAAIARAADTIATWREIAVAIKDRKERRMSLTGCSEVAALCRDDMKRAKERMSEVFAKLNGARTRADEAAAVANRLADMVDEEVAELERELRQMTNLPLSSGVSEDASRTALDDASARAAAPEIKPGSPA